MAEQFYYSSVLAPYMNHLLEVKISAGISALRTKWILKEIDGFANEENLNDPHITEPFFNKWRATRIADCDRTLYAKYSVWSQLTKLMCRCGCACFIPRIPKQPKPDFTPYIFTKEQIAAILSAADDCRLYDIRMGTSLIVMPALLRLLYSTGMRISEALSIRNKHVHLDEGYILLDKTKNGSERIVPICESMKEVLETYMRYRDRMPINGISADNSLLFVKSDGTIACISTYANCLISVVFLSRETITDLVFTTCDIRMRYMHLYRWDITEWIYTRLYQFYQHLLVTTRLVRQSSMYV